MLDKIYDTYTQYRFDILDRFENPKHFGGELKCVNIVIKERIIKSR